MAVPSAKQFTVRPVIRPVSSAHPEPIVITMPPRRAIRMPTHHPRGGGTLPLSKYVQRPVKKPIQSHN